MRWFCQAEKVTSVGSTLTPFAFAWVFSVWLSLAPICPQASMVTH
jgi:hypothetical protein